MSDEPDLLDRLPRWTVPAFLLGVPILLWFGTKIAYDAVYLDVIWQYYWGPIKADAAGGALTQGGVTAEPGYNVVNTLSWAVLLGVCILGIAQLLRRFKQPVNDALVLGATGWVVVGSIFHVLQDTKLFLPPLEYWFITPPIYLLFGAFGVFSWLAGVYLKTIAEAAGVRRALEKLWILMVLPVLLWTALWIRSAQGDATWADKVVDVLHPGYVLAYSLLTFALMARRFEAKNRIDPAELLLMSWIPWLLVSLTYVWQYNDIPWPGKIPGDGMATASLWAPLGSLVICGIVYAVAKWRVDAGSEKATAFLRPINLLVIFAHALDGIATGIGIDVIGGYSEKHIVSEAIRQGTENLSSALGFAWGVDYPTFVGFLTAKVLLGIVVVYVLGQSAREAGRETVMLGLTRFAIIMVGIGPGIRNMVRMSLGV